MRSRVQDVQLLPNVSEPSQGDGIRIPRAEDGHYGEFSISDDRIKKHGGLLYLRIIAAENLTHSIKKNQS